MPKKNRLLNKVPVLGIIFLIIIGSFILRLPICNTKPMNFMDSLLLSTSSICVTSLSNIIISEQLTFVGQVFLILLTEIGSLGFMSCIVFILILKKKKIRFSEIKLLEDGNGEDIYSNFKQSIKTTMKYTFGIEIVGMIFLAIKFIPMYGVKQGIWFSLFHSVMGFCNCAFDLFGANSMMRFHNDVYINFVFVVLIFLGGIGFVVLEDLGKCIRKKSLKELSFQSKLILSVSAILFVSSIFLIKLMQPNLSWIEVIFMSVSLRSAGFYSINLAKCSVATKILFMILMFIGGAPGSTAGGIKVVVFSILILAIISTLKNRKEIVIFYRKINYNLVYKAITITGISLLVILIGIISMAAFNDIGLGNIVFLCVSVFTTTGLSLVELELLNTAGKIIVMVLMFIGRLGPIVAFRLFFNLNRKPENSNIDYVEGKLIL